MKKFGLFFAVLFASALIFGTNAYATMNTEPVSKPYLELQPFEYQIQRGDNLTKLAKTFGVTVDELHAVNEGNSAVKNKNLILAGGKLRVPLYTPESLEKLAKFYDGVVAAEAYEQRQDNRWLFAGLVTATWLVVILGAVVWIAILQNGKLKQKLHAADDDVKKLSSQIWDTEDNLTRVSTKAQELATALKTAQAELAMSRLKPDLTPGSEYVVSLRERDVKMVVSNVILSCGECASKVEIQNDKAHAKLHV